MAKRCDCGHIFDEPWLGRCQGKLMLYNTNARDHTRCEWHAKVVEAWIGRGHPLPLIQYVKALAEVGPEKLSRFWEEATAIRLDENVWIEYVEPVEPSTEGRG